MTYDELIQDNRYKYHHTSYIRKYVSRKIDGIVTPYKGRFGTGYTVDTPNRNSSIYSYRTYYILKEQEI